MSKIEVSSTPEGKADAIALAVFVEEGTEKKASAQVPRLLFQGKRSKEWDTLVSKLRESKHFFAKKNETNVLRYYEFASFPSTLLLGLGPKKNWNIENARQAGAALASAQKKERFAKVSLLGESVFADLPESELANWLQAFCEGYWLSGYEFRDLKKEERAPFEVQGLDVSGLKGAGLEKAVSRAQSLAKAVNFARSLGDRPGNHLTPTILSQLVSKMAKEHSLRCTVWGRTEIAREKMGLFLGVAQGSAEEPRFIILEHRGGKKTDRPVALVGKGITFDSGGISLKPAARMEDMKYDMMGASAVAGIMQAVADLDLPLNVVAFIATCENMPDGKAQKPGDVARSRNGKTVEVINTDAEGRLILADTLEYAQTYHPQAIIDFATLTGAVVDALGSVASGLMGNHQGLIDQIKHASEMTGERVWQLPLYEEYEEDLKSHVADIKNSGIREAGSSKGGTFLKFFVDSKYPWAHCDIAGTAYHRRDVNYHPQKYGSGVMVRAITSLLSNWKPLK